MSASGGVTLKDNTESVQASEVSLQKVRVSSIPLYPSSEEYDYFVDPPSRTEKVVRDARISAEKVKNDFQPFLDKVSYIYNTGVAHTNESLISLRDEDHLLARIGFMTLGGFIGLASARKGRFLKKLVYTSIGTGGFGAVCYPQQAKNLATDGLDLTKKNIRIGYHFIVGSRPQVQNADGNALKSIGTMASDIGEWSANLLKKLKPAPSTNETAEKSVVPESSDSENLPKTEDLKSGETSTEASAASVEQVEEPTSPIIKEECNNLEEKDVEKVKLEATAEIVAEEPPVIAEEPPVIAEEPSVITEEPSVIAEEPSVIAEEPPVVAPTEIEKPETVAEVIVEDSTISNKLEEVKPEIVTEVAEESVSKAVEEVPKIEVAEEVKLSIEGDYGQSYAEDKIMYTTRE